jgi:RNA polymerase sigma-70 factor (ECF subfamily)
MNLVTLRAADPSPSELVARVATGDEDAFRMLYRSHSPAAYGLALRVTRDEHMAQDVLQEAFSDLWAQAGRFDPQASSVRSWVTMLTHRRAVDRVRREQGDRDRVSQWATSTRERDHDSVAEVVELRAEHRRVRQAMDGLTRLQRESLELAFLAGLTHTEVAERLDIPLGTAKTRIRDALRSLRTELEGDL